MGEMADYINDSMFDSYLVDGYDDRIACKFCGKICSWGEHFYSKDKSGFRLFEWETGKLHICKKYKQV
jgi:hypothetical protein